MWLQVRDESLCCQIFRNTIRASHNINIAAGYMFVVSVCVIFVFRMLNRMREQAR